MKIPIICLYPALRSRIVESRDRLYRVALAWCGDTMLADDLVQETVVVALDRLHQLRDPQRLYAWMWGIMYHKWQHHLRDRRNCVELDDQLCSEDPSPSEVYQVGSIVDRVRSIVAALPQDQRIVISLVDLDGLSYCEVAEILDIPIGTVMSRLHRARKRLLGAFDESNRVLRVVKAE